MKSFNTSIVFIFMFLLVLTVSAQDDKVKTSLEFQNSETATRLVKNHIAALQNGDVDAMTSQLHEKVVIYGLGRDAEPLNITQHKDFFINSTKQYTHAIGGDLYVPLKIENSSNAGEWLLSWGNNTITDKETGKQIQIPFHMSARVDGDKIIWMRYFVDLLNIAEGQGFTLTPPKK